MNIKDLEIILKESNQPSFRLKQIFKAIYQDGILDFEKINNIPKSLKESLKDFSVLCFSIDEIQEGIDSKKALIKLQDDKFIESVLIKNATGFTACISTQVGCAMNCSFCATGQNGFKRNLTSEEITDQILFWKNYLSEKKEGLLKNIVYMGMGEPFLNYENVKESIQKFTDPSLFNIGDRSISVSTSFPSNINVEKLVKEFPQINIAISLHFADNKKRSLYMPINNKTDLDDISKFASKYLQTYNRKLFFEYIMLDDINDNEYDAKKLIEYIKNIDKNYLIHVNLIRYNTTFKNFNSSKKEKIIKFEHFLKREGISETLRKSMGEDINGACGQLAGKK